MLLGLSILVGNDIVILSGPDFLTYYTELDHIPWAMSQFAAANPASMVLFQGDPTNVIIREGFGVNNFAFTAYTILPFLVRALASYAILTLQFWRKRYLPRYMPVARELDPRRVFLDSMGAMVGSILLGFRLAVVIIVGFFKVDV